MKPRTPPKLKPTGPLESDLLAWILASLGVEQFELRKGKSGKIRHCSLHTYLARDGSLFWRNNSGSLRNDAGVPISFGCKGSADILGSIPIAPGVGQSIALEVKRDDGEQSDSQKRWQKWAEAAGYVYAVVRSPSEARAVVDSIRARRVA